jgi:AcrR family transcriptional regulator
MTVQITDKDSIQSADSSRPMRADARRNRDRVLAAAREVFGHSGADAQMDDVARVAGVGVGTVYRQFPTKEALIGEIVRQTFARFAVSAEEALRSASDPFEALAWLLHRNAEQLAGDAATRYAMGTGTALWEAAAAERARLETLAGELIARGRREGSVRADLTVADIGMVMCGLASSMARGFDWRRHLQLLLDGLRGPAARPGASGD